MTPFEEIAGVRYATWHADATPFDVRSIWPWKEYALVLAGFMAYKAALVYLIALAVLRSGTFEYMLLATLLFALSILGLFMWWALRKRFREDANRYREWKLRRPDVQGVPSRVLVNGGLTRLADTGLVTFDGPHLKFQGQRFDLLLQPSDLAQNQHGLGLNFEYASPFGKRAIRLNPGGESEGGRMKPREAQSLMERDLEHWRAQVADTMSVYMPLRHLFANVPIRFWALDIPLRLAALTASVIMLDRLLPNMVTAVFHQQRPLMQLNPLPRTPIAEYVTMAAVIFGGYVVVLLLIRWGGIMRRRHNLAVDRRTLSAGL